MGKRFRWGATAVLGMVFLSGCNDQVVPSAPQADPVTAAVQLDLPHARETRLPNGRLEIVMPRDFDDSRILARVKRHEEDVDGLKATTFSSGGVALTVLRTHDGRPRASMLVSADGSTNYKLNGIEQGRLQPGVASGPLQQRGRFLEELRRTRRALVPGVSFYGEEVDPCLETAVTACPIMYPSGPIGLPPYTKYIANLDTDQEYSILRDSNGCSSSPDGHWAGCCDMHDFAYDDGGATDEERKTGDLMLWDCMMRVGGPADEYYVAVRTFGSNGFNWRDVGGFGKEVCAYAGAQNKAVYGPGRYINNPWGFVYPMGSYRYSDECRAKGFT